MLLETPRTVHLPTEGAAAQTVVAPVKTVRKSLRLSDLRSGETARIVKVQMGDAGCRKRFAELGLAEGMKVTVTGTGDTLMLALGGSRMGLACRCAEQILVVRVSA
jgi:Fe2+ transport system protein FeoA